MGDGLKLSRDKRHKSSSSITGSTVEGTRSERKLDIRESILEVDDQFALAEARCDDLQHKIDLVKGLKKRRKLKKRSSTRVTDVPAAENVPFISVRTQPKKKFSQHTARYKRVEVPETPVGYHIPPNPTRGYLDPATVEQHQMIGQVHEYHQTFAKPSVNKNQFGDKRSGSQRSNHIHVEGGDSFFGPAQNKLERDNTKHVESENEPYNSRPREQSGKKLEVRIPMKSPSVVRQRQGGRDVPAEVSKRNEESIKSKSVHPQSKRLTANRTPQTTAPTTTKVEERQIVELFNKDRSSPSSDCRPSYDLPSSPEIRARKSSGSKQNDQEVQMLMAGTTFEDRLPPKKRKHPRHVKYRSQRYEMPTIASQMKQASMRYNVPTQNISNIPFIVTKSTAPSHNIGINIQQVLNSMKVQQPLSGIPSTIAHHMGLGYAPHGSKSPSVQPPLDNRGINAIKVGHRLLRLPSYKSMSYNRMLNLYREGDGMVPRFLRSISRPHYFYTSMYNLLSNRDDNDAATSKGRGSQEAKQSLAEYAGLYREYEQLEKILEEGAYDSEIDRRRAELARELAGREEHIRRVVQEYQATTQMNQSPLRASASNAVDYRHSTFKMNNENQE